MQHNSPRDCNLFQLSFRCITIDARAHQMTLIDTLLYTGRERRSAIRAHVVDAMGLVCVDTGTAKHMQTIEFICINDYLQANATLFVLEFCHLKCSVSSMSPRHVRIHDARIARYGWKRPIFGQFRENNSILASQALSPVIFWNYITIVLQARKYNYNGRCNYKKIAITNHSGYQGHLFQTHWYEILGSRSLQV